MSECSGLERDERETKERGGAREREGPGPGLGLGGSDQGLVLGSLGTTIFLRCLLGSGFWVLAPGIWHRSRMAGLEPAHDTTHGHDVSTTSWQ